MMISAAPPEARQIPPSSSTTNCSLKQEQRGFPLTVARMMGLDTAAVLLGKGRLAEELCITPRDLNYKLNGERGVSDENVKDAALALEERAEKLLTHARKLRAVLPVTPGQARG